DWAPAQSPGSRLGESLAHPTPRIQTGFAWRRRAARSEARTRTTAPSAGPLRSSDRSVSNRASDAATWSASTAAPYAAIGFRNAFRRFFETTASSAFVGVWVARRYAAASSPATTYGW